MDSSTESSNFSLASMDMSNISLDILENSVTTDASHENENNENLPNAIVDRLISMYLRHNWSLVGLEDVADFFNMDREMCVKLPTKKRRILKLFAEHRDLIEIFYFVKCNKCQKTVSIKSDSSEQVKCCDKVLKKTETNFFVYLPLQKQLAQSIENNWSYIKEFDTSSKDGIYSDAHDGEILKNILKQYENEDINILSLCLNVDGANKYKSNKFSLWPMQFTQNFLPPQIRFQTQNILVNGLFYTESEKNLNFRDYLLPLIYELNHLKENNIASTIEGQDYMFKPIVTHLCVDLPAKAKIQETKQFGGYNACTYCEIPGELLIIQSSNEEDGCKVKPKRKQKHKEPVEQVRYVEGKEEYPLRGEKETLKKMLLASSSRDDVDGVKDISCLSALEHFNIISGVSVEYMHCILLGLTKRILGLFLESKNSNSPFYILPKNKKLLSDRITAIKPNADVVRKPRGLDQKADFKASEFRSLLLYYLPVCLEGCLPKVYVQHIRLLSGAVYILLQTSITSEEIHNAEKSLKTFVKQHQDLFGKENMVMNVHLLKHLGETVRELGPLWCHSAFPFERNNGVLLKMVNGTTDVLLQIASKYCLKKSLIQKGKKPEKKTVVEDEILLGKEENIVEKSLHVFNTETLKELDFSKKDLHVHKRIKLGNVTYTSLLYTKPKKSIDYFIGLKNDLIGMAKFYMKFDNKIYVVMDGYETVDYINHISKVQRTNQNILAPIEDIEMKYIYMKVGFHQYVTSPPNPYEIE